MAQEIHTQHSLPDFLLHRSTFRHHHRKGGLGLPTVISVLFFVVYWVTSMTAERVAVAGDLNMFVGVWLSSIILFPVGVFLTIKATSDSALLDADSWRNAFKKLTHLHSKS